MTFAPRDGLPLSDESPERPAHDSQFCKISQSRQEARGRRGGRTAPPGKMEKALPGSYLGHPPSKVAAAPLECGRFVSMDATGTRNLTNRPFFLFCATGWAALVRAVSRKTCARFTVALVESLRSVHTNRPHSGAGRPLLRMCGPISYEARHPGCLQPYRARPSGHF